MADSNDLDRLQARIRAHPANHRILEWMRLDPAEPIRHFGTWAQRGHGLDPSGRHLCSDVAESLPEYEKFVIGMHTGCVHPAAGRLHPAAGRLHAAANE
ncbi:MAG: hypothetical protein AAF799_05225 [Myxococcota bacterium]